MKAVKNILPGLRYALLSAFLLWHTLALVIGPAPGSALMAKIYPLFVPYLDSFNINNQWGFFAPDPHAGSLPRYIVRSEGGDEHIFRLTEVLHRGEPGFLRYASLYLTLARQREPYLSAAMHYLCRRHAELQPRSVQLFVGHQLRLKPDDYLAGARPLDDSYVTVEYLEPVRCDNTGQDTSMVANGD